MEGSNSTSINNSVAVNNNASVPETVDVKVSFKQEIRRFQLAAGANLASLQAKVRALFAINERSPIVLLYRDDEDDLVTMNLEEEVAYALKVSGGLLRLEVRVQLAQDEGVSIAKLEARPFAEERSSGWEDKPWKKMGRHGPHFGHHGHPGQFSPAFFGPRPHHGPHAHGPHPVHSASENEPQEAFGRGRGRRCHRPEQEAKPASDDIERGCQDKLKARHVKDITIPDGTVVLPGVPFVKTWRIRNAGTVDWPANTRMLFISHKGDHMGGPEFVPVEGIVQAGTEVDISVNQIAPKESGDYSGFWRLTTEDGKKFGQRFWVSIKVVAESSSSSESSGFEHIPAPIEYVQLLQQVINMGYTDIPKRRIEHLLYKFGGNVQTVVEKLEKRRGMKCKREGREKKEGCDRKKH